MGDLCAKVDKIKWNNTNSEYTYIDLSSVDVENHFISETATINNQNAPSRAQQIVHKNDIIFGTTRPMQKRLAYITEKYDNQICSTGYCVLRNKSCLAVPKWIYYQLMSSRFYSYVEAYQEGASYPCISDDKVKQYIIPLPTIKEQERIVEILDRFDKLCNDLSEGLPAEIEKRQKQYEYFREKLLQFDKSL